MDEINQKNIILILTCLIVVFFHYAYKFKNNIRFSSILLGCGFLISLILTLIIRNWEKENKVDYNLPLFLYFLIDIFILIFIIYRWCSIKGIMTGGGNKLNILDDFKKQDFMIRDISANPLSGIIGEKIKHKLTDYIVEIISKFNF